MKDRARRQGAMAAALLLAGLAPASGPRAGLILAATTRQGCAADYAKFCNPPRVGAPIQNSCLRQYWVSLSADCRKALGPRDSGGGTGDTGGEP